MKAVPYLLAAAAGLSLFIVFPNPRGVHLPLLAWVALAPLVFALETAPSPRRAALVAATAGFAGYPLFYHWLVYCMTTYGQMPAAVAWLVLLAMVAVLAGFLAVFGYSYHQLRTRLGLSPLLAAPVVWTAIDLIRGHFPFGGFPWALIADSQADVPVLIQIAELTGPYGVTFAIITANAALADAAIIILNARKPDLARRLGLAPADETLRHRRPRRWLVRLGLALGLPLLLLLYGAVRVPMVDRAFASQPEIKIGVVQPNIAQDVKWDLEFFFQSLQEHLDLTHRLMIDRPQLVIWPEAALTAPGGFNYNWENRTQVVTDYLVQIDTYLLTGALSYQDCDNPLAKMRGCSYNSAYLISPRAEKLLDRYDKIHLVPFGEYVPLARLFFFADAVAQGNTGVTTPGANLTIMSGPGAYFGCVVCYEVIFPDLVRKFKKNGAKYMTTITNDAWFGPTGAPYQHLQNVVFRAVENRVYFARSANTGISALIDPTGRVLHQTGLYQPDAFIATVKPSPLNTPYTAVGDLFAYLNAAACAALAATAFVRTRVRGAAEGKRKKEKGKR